MQAVRTAYGSAPQGAPAATRGQMLAAALAYAAHGWPVLPVAGKRPALADWPAAASIDPDLIRSWRAQRPDYNVGIVTGPRSGLAVLDVDPRHGGTDSLGALEERVGVLPGTVMSRTGGGGMHLLFVHPGVKVTSSAHQLGPGLDVKADGGQIVAPPSVHPETGRAYEWHGGVWDHGVVPWPAALLPPQAVPGARQPSLRPVVHHGGAGLVERRLASGRGAGRDGRSRGRAEPTAALVGVPLRPDGRGRTDARADGARRAAARRAGGRAVHNGGAFDDPLRPAS